MCPSAVALRASALSASEPRGQVCSGDAARQEGADGSSECEGRCAMEQSGYAGCLQAGTKQTPTPVWLQADPRRLEQVFVNLLANASRYTESGGELTVWVHAREGQAVVRIRDSGIGIAPDALPHIFD